jgi:hypothetical protein
MTVYGPYTRKDGRQHVVIVDNSIRRTVSYPKYLLEQKLNRLLLPAETCDHINGDYNDNRLENLQILSRQDNIRKHAALKPAELGTFTCPICFCSFTKSMSEVRANRKKSYRGPYCSRSCAGKSGRVVQRKRQAT